MIYPAVVFWFDRPPVVEKGSFNYFSTIWPGDVYYIINKDHRKERKVTNWDSSDFGNAKVVKLFDCVEEESRLGYYFRDPQTIHVLNGFDTEIVKRIKPWVLNDKMRSVLFTERPAITGGFCERVIRKIYLKYKYSRLVKEYIPYVKTFLPLGLQGVHSFEECGVPNERMFDFMYCPALQDLSSNRKPDTHDPIRFLYVGRFYYKTKGTDVLMKALPYLVGNWSLSCVGGYGKDSEEVLSSIEHYSNVEYCGVWDSHEVVKNMQNYDVVVVPSRADGWNLLINEALHAGIAVITSDQAVSHEVLSAESAGIFKSGNSKELSAIMQKVIDNPSIASDWMKNEREIIGRINMQSVGYYFKGILEYSFMGAVRPSCPWL